MYLFKLSVASCSMINKYGSADRTLLLKDTSGHFVHVTCTGGMTVTCTDGMTVHMFLSRHSVSTTHFMKSGMQIYIV